MNAYEPQESAIRAAIAEDHPLFREALIRSLAGHPAVDLVGEATDGPSALALAEDVRPDVLLLDVNLPRLDGLAVCERITRGAPPRSQTKVLMLSAYMDERVIAAAVRAGASGYLGKDSAAEEIAEAVVRVSRGGVVFTARAEPDLPLLEGIRPAGAGRTAA